MARIRRRDLLTGSAAFLVGGRMARGEVIGGKLPWQPDAGSPPHTVQPGGWKYFTRAEAGALEALVDRIIPPDPETPGGKDAGCAVFIDRQMAGSYGRSEGLYNEGPFHDGVEQQGPQSDKTPAEMYRAALAALDRYCQDHAASGGSGKPFAQLTPELQDAILHDLEDGKISLEGTDAKKFFKQLAARHAAGLLCRPDLWRQPQHVRVEDDWLPGRPL